LSPTRFARCESRAGSHLLSIRADDRSDGLRDQTDHTVCSARRSASSNRGNVLATCLASSLLLLHRMKRNKSRHLSIQPIAPTRLREVTGGAEKKAEVKKPEVYLKVELVDILISNYSTSS
jgi:hypothetical protein